MEAKRKTSENTQAGSIEAEPLIKIKKRKVKNKTDVEDQERAQDEETDIRRRRKEKSSFAEVYHNLKFFGDTAEDEKRKRIVVETLLRLPPNVIKKTLDEALFISLRTEGVTFRFNGSVKLRKKDFKQAGEFYHGQIVLHFIILNFRKCAKERKMDVTAHEIAHFILGHHLKKKTNMGVIERDADDLAESWGFKRGYKDYNF